MWLEVESEEDNDNGIHAEKIHCASDQCGSTLQNNLDNIHGCNEPQSKDSPEVGPLEGYITESDHDDDSMNSDNNLSGRYISNDDSTNNMDHGFTQDLLSDLDDLESENRENPPSDIDGDSDNEENDDDTNNNGVDDDFTEDLPSDLDDESENSENPPSNFDCFDSDNDDENGEDDDDGDGRHIPDADGENGGYGDFNIPNPEDPVAPGAFVSNGQAMSLIVAFIVRHGLTNVAVEDLLDLINLLLPNSVPATRYLFNKDLKFTQNIFEAHLFCIDCDSYLSKYDDAENMDSCPRCQRRLDRAMLLKEGAYFIYIPLRAQLSEMLPLFRLTKKTELQQAESVTCMLNGNCMRELVVNGQVTDDDITLIFNCDGAPIFKSSKRAI